MNTLSTATLGGLPPRSIVPQVKLKVSGQSIPNSTNTLISWSSAVSNTDTMWASGTPTQITVQTAGTYVVTINIGWASNGTGFRFVFGLLNGTTAGFAVCKNQQAGAAFAVAAIGTTQTVSAVLPNLAVGNTFFVLVNQGSGGALSTVNNAFSASVSDVSMWRIGP